MNGPRTRARITLGELVASRVVATQLVDTGVDWLEMGSWKSSIFVVKSY
jgi:hypothetical protein